MLLGYGRIMHVHGEYMTPCLTNDSLGAMIAVGLQGAHADDYVAIVDAIHDTFRHVVENGLDRAEIDATLHQIELSRKHQTSGFGMSVGLGVSDCVLYHAAIVSVLHVVVPPVV